MVLSAEAKKYEPELKITRDYIQINRRYFERIFCLYDFKNKLVFSVCHSILSQSIQFRYHVEPESRPTAELLSCCHFLVVVLSSPKIKMNMPSLISDLRESPSSPNYSIIFDFELNFDKSLKRQWMIAHWHQAFYYIGIYMLLIFGGQAYMQSRSRFELRRTLAAWNVFLAAFSIFGLCRTLPELAHVLKEFGFTHSVCNPSFIEEVKVSGFWTWMFTLSKVPELGDTIFIVLRKQQLIFLHWYHHITVLLFTWYSYTEHIAPARWFVVMNYFAHSMMYTYYAMRAMRFKMPRFVAILITSSQILQMVAGCFVSYFGYITRRKGEFCQLPDNIANYALLMYASYFVLFARFFYNTYISIPTKTRKLE